MNDHTKYVIPVGIPPSGSNNAIDTKAFEKLLDRALTKCDSTKNDLDSLWTNQIIAVGASVALVVGLDKALSLKFFGDPNYGRVLYIILPLINLYFIMRFGFMTYAFSQARSAAEALSIRFIDDRGLSPYIRDDPNLPERSRIDRDVLFATNSYFEPIYQNTNSFRELMLVYVYSFFIPVVLALSQSTSIYLLFKVLNPGIGAWTIIVLFIYSTILISLYITLYNSLRKLLFQVPNIVLFIDVVSPVLTIAFLFVLARYCFTIQ